MKVLFTADWHIKLRQKDVPKEWQTNRFRLLFDKMEELVAKYNVDLIINGGDIFDTIPNMEELWLYFTYIRSIKTKTIIYDGNHEATRKGQTFLSFLTEATHKLNSNVEIITESTNKLGIDFVPYTGLHSIGKFSKQSNILCTHVRGEIPPHVKPEIDLSVFDKWDTVLAGDLHAHSNTQRNIVYPGSPLSTSFHRSKVTTGVIIFDTDTLEYEFVKLDIPQLYKFTISSEEDAIEDSFNHVVYELETTIADSKEITTSDNVTIKKKLKHKTSNAGLNLKGLTLTEEVIQYLTNVLKISQEDIDETIKLLHDHTKNSRMV